MKRLIIKTGIEDEFFARGRHIAKLADAGKPLPEERVVGFDDPAELLKLLTTARLTLFRTVKEHPGTITAIAHRLHRDRAAVKRDVDELAKAGIVEVAEKVLPGHGRMKEVRVAAPEFRLEARVA